MDPIPVDITRVLLPAGSKEILYAKDQPEYRPLPSVRTPAGRVVTEWMPTEEEKAALLAGHPITLVMHTFEGRCHGCGMSLGLTPLSLLVGAQVDLSQER